MENSHFKTLSKGAILMFLGICLSKILGYIYRIITTQLGPEDYGRLSLILAIIGLTSIISIFGLDFGVYKFTSEYFISNENSKLKSKVISATKLSFLISIIITTILILLADKIATQLFHDPTLKILIIIIAIGIPIDTIKSIFCAGLKGIEKIEYEIIIRLVIENIIKIALTIILIYLGFGIIGATIAYVLALLISLIMIIYFVLKKKVLDLKDLKKEKIIDKEIINYSWPLLLNGIIIMVISWADTIFLGIFQTTKEVGIYNIATPTAKLSLIIPISITALYLPVITKIYAEKEIFKKIYQNITKYILILMLIPTIIFLIIPEKIIQILFGLNYINGANALIILSIGYLTLGIMYSSREILIYLKKTKRIFLITIISGAINIILSLILIPKYSIIGASLATSLTFIVMSLGFLIETYKETKTIPYNLESIKIIMIAILLGVLTKMIINLIAFNELINVALFCSIFIITYIIMLIITGIIGQTEKTIILDLIKKLIVNPLFKQKI